MKKILKLILPLFLLFNTVPVIAQTLDISTASYAIVVNGKKWQPDNPIIAINGKTYIPLTEIADILDVDVSWNEKKRQVEINNDSSTSQEIDDENTANDDDSIEESDSEENYSSYFDWLMNWYGFNDDEENDDAKNDDDEIIEETENNDYQFALDWLWKWGDDSQIQVSYGNSTESENSSSQNESTSTKKYVASKSGSKYHLPTCSSAKKIKTSNKTYFSSESKAENAGYNPCSICIK